MSYIDWDNDPKVTSETVRSVLAEEFETTISDDIEILVAVYEYENYSGQGFVVFRQGDKVYEVNASHCSCYGVEGQWEPEEINLKELLSRPAYLGWTEGEIANDRIRRHLIKALL